MVTLASGKPRTTVSTGTSRSGRTSRSCTNASARELAEPGCRFVDSCRAGSVHSLSPFRGPWWRSPGRALQMSSVSQVDAMHSPVDAIQPMRNWQSRKISQIACAATILFTAQLYLSPAAWFPETEPLHIALVLSFVALSALVVFRMLANRPLWLGWRSLFLGLYCATAVLSPIWSIDPPTSVGGALEVAKHFLFFLAIVNALTTPKRIRVAILLFAIASIVPGWGTFWNWWHDELLVEGFRGRWLGVMADPNHDAMALVGALPILLFLTTGRGHRTLTRIAAVLGSIACIAGVIATHSRGGSIGLAVAVSLFALLSRRKAIAGMLVMVLAGGVLLFAPTSF